jgi:hypothetical protein
MSFQSDVLIILQGKTHQNEENNEFKSAYESFSEWFKEILRHDFICDDKRIMKMDQLTLTCIEILDEDDFNWIMRSLPTFDGSEVNFDPPYRNEKEKKITVIQEILNRAINKIVAKEVEIRSDENINGTTFGNYWKKILLNETIEDFIKEIIKEEFGSRIKEFNTFSGEKLISNN